jgi:hypothetical protein
MYQAKRGSIIPVEVFRKIKPIAIHLNSRGGTGLPIHSTHTHSLPVSVICPVLARAGKTLANKKLSVHPI